MSKISQVAIALALVSLAACVPTTPQGPRIRVATASARELADAENKDVVWYEFEPGDVVPMKIGFVGAVQGGATEEGAVFRAKRKLYFVMRKNQPMEISFDGKTFAGPNSTKFVVAVVPRDGQPAGQLIWIMYVGESGDMQAALEAEIKEGKSKPGK